MDRIKAWAFSINRATSGYLFLGVLTLPVCLQSPLYLILGVVSSVVSYLSYLQSINKQIPHQRLQTFIYKWITCLVNVCLIGAAGRFLSSTGESIIGSGFHDWILETFGRTPFLNTLPDFLAGGIVIIPALIIGVGLESSKSLDLTLNTTTILLSIVMLVKETVSSSAHDASSRTIGSTSSSEGAQSKNESWRSPAVEDDEEDDFHPRFEKEMVVSGLSLLMFAGVSEIFERQKRLQRRLNWLSDNSSSALGETASQPPQHLQARQTNSLTKIPARSIFIVGHHLLSALLVALLTIYLPTGRYELDTDITVLWKMHDIEASVSKFVAVSLSVNGLALAVLLLSFPLHSKIKEMTEMRILPDFFLKQLPITESPLIGCAFIGFLSSIFATVMDTGNLLSIASFAWILASSVSPIFRIYFFLQQLGSSPVMQFSIPPLVEERIQRRRQSRMEKFFNRLKDFRSESHGELTGRRSLSILGIFGRKNDDTIALVPNEATIGDSLREDPTSGMNELLASDVSQSEEPQAVEGTTEPSAEPGLRRGPSLAAVQASNSQERSLDVGEQPLIIQTILNLYSVQSLLFTLIILTVSLAYMSSYHIMMFNLTNPAHSSLIGSVTIGQSETTLPPAFNQSDLASSIVSVNTARSSRVWNSTQQQLYNRLLLGVPSHHMVITHRAAGWSDEWRGAVDKAAFPVSVIPLTVLASFFLANLILVMLVLTAHQEKTGSDPGAHNNNGVNQFLHNHSQVGTRHMEQSQMAGNLMMSAGWLLIHVIALYLLQCHLFPLLVNLTALFVLSCWLSVGFLAWHLSRNRLYQPAGLADPASHRRHSQDARENGAGQGAVDAGHEAPIATIA